MIKTFLYCVARYKREEDGSRKFLEYGAPFVDLDDDHVRFLVCEALKNVKDKIDASLFSVVKIGEFYPDVEKWPVISYGEPDYLPVSMVVEDCSVLFAEVVKDEQK